MCDLSINLYIDLCEWLWHCQYYRSIPSSLWEGKSSSWWRYGHSSYVAIIPLPINKTATAVIIKTNSHLCNTVLLSTTIDPRRKLGHVPPRVNHTLSRRLAAVESERGSLWVRSLAIFLLLVLALASRSVHCSETETLVRCKKGKPFRRIVEWRLIIGAKR